jgi:hypothetical protein
MRGQLEGPPEFNATRLCSLAAFAGFDESQAEDFPMSLLHSTCCRAATPNGPSNDRWARDCFDALENGEIKVLREIE